MIKHSGRLLLIMAAVVLAVGLWSHMACAAVTILGGTTDATANSVWNFGATWQDDKNLKPFYMPDVDVETVAPDPGYTRYGETPAAYGRNTVIVATAPLPEAWVTYAIPVTFSLDGSVKLKINPGILDFDPNRTNPQDVDAKYLDRPGLNNPLMGVYETPNPGPNDTNYFVAGKYTSTAKYGVITIDKSLVQPNWTEWATVLYVKVSAFAVDGVWTSPGDSSDPRFPKRINYLRQREWVGGVITGTWRGSGNSVTDPASDIEPNAYAVKPDVEPNAKRMQAVTDVFLPQIMSGIALDPTRVMPADYGRIKHVLGVYALLNMVGTRFDDMHVSPADPSAITFISAVYGIGTMEGTPLDARHIAPKLPADILRVQSVTVAGHPDNYVDDTNPFEPGDDSIALKQDLPGGTAEVTITYETVDLYDADNPDLAYTRGEAQIALNRALPEGSTEVRIVYGINTGLDGANHYDAANSSTAFRPGETEIVLSTPLPTGTTDVRILYGTDEPLRARGTRIDAGEDLNVASPSLASISRISGVYPVLEMDGVRQVGAPVTQGGTLEPTDPNRMIVAPNNPDSILKVLRVYDSSNIDYYDANTTTQPFVPGDETIKLTKALPVGTQSVTIRYDAVSSVVVPFEPNVVREVLGVYPVTSMSATVVNSTRVEPAKPYSIRGVRGVYATANEPGTPDGSDSYRKTVVPSVPQIMGSVVGVYDNRSLTGTNYFDPKNAETTYRAGDDIIKLSKALPAGLSSVTIQYETINLVTNTAGAFTQGGTQVTLDTALPTSDPVMSPMPIRVEYVTNANYYLSGTGQIRLRQPLPSDSVDAVIVYASTQNLYETKIIAPRTSPVYAPGDPQIPLKDLLPKESNSVVIEYSAHLFRPAYDPRDYDPADAATLPLRPFLVGDKLIRVNRLKPDVALPARYTTPGAVKLCIAYQSLDKVPTGDYDTGGTIHLPVPLPCSDNDGTVLTLPLRVNYRALNNITAPIAVGDQKSPKLPDIWTYSRFTLGRPYMGYVTEASYWVPELVLPQQPPLSLPAISADGVFSWWCPPGLQRATITYRRAEPDSAQGCLWTGLGGKYLGRIPLYHVPDSGVNAVAGMNYRVAASAGFNMSNPLQQPAVNLEENTPYNTNRLIFDPRFNPMWYAPSLKAKGNGAANTLPPVAIFGVAYEPGSGFKTVAATQTLTIHDSRPVWQADMIDHGGNTFRGIWGGRDSLESYGYAGSKDPLIPEPAAELSLALPDDGSSSTEFVFRVRYQNADGLPPLPWLGPNDDPWNVWTDRPSGVVLYLDEKGTGDYQPHFMGPEDPNVTGAGAMYIYRIMPHSVMGVRADVANQLLPFAYDGTYRTDTYQSLACGNYHYFFACSDDSLKFDDGHFPFEYQSFAGQLEWGQTFATVTSSSTGIDPSLARNVTGYGEINRPAKRRYSTFGTEAYDGTIFVDRPALVPGLFQYTNYPLAADDHPRVTCQLGMPPVDALGVQYDDEKYGNGRFFGTLDPFRRMVNPNTRYQGMWAESSGSTAQTDNVFRILWKQIDNKAPIDIRVYINNASTKSGTTPEYAYTSYTMYPRAGQTQPFNYRTGVWYEYKTKLPAGAHTYYFRGYDGEHVVRFPVRPDRYVYDVGTDPAAKSYWDDWWVPSTSEPSDFGKEGYFDNDYVPGPYVNSPCMLSEATVTPSSGREGQTFRYRVKYTDSDGQRPYSGTVYIETRNGGPALPFSMVPETPFIDPAADHSAEYKAGVYYVLDTGTIKDLALENGVRRFYFEFMDDWGEYSDLNDTVQGELTRYPQGASNWITGPVISGNRAPTLTGGSVTPEDGTANAATRWNFKVTYRDLDNDAPALLKVFVGLLQQDGRTITWDDGHVLAASNSSDKVYSDGADFFFQSRLGAADITGGNEEKQYFYAFEAYDGTDWATYNSSSSDELRSDSAGCRVMDDLVRVDSQNYKIRPLLGQQATVVTASSVTPSNPADILRVWGVYRTEDMDNAADATQAANLCNLGAQPPLYTGGPITLTTDLTGSPSAVWVKYEARSPIVGPLPIELPAPAGVIPDAEVYEDYTNTPSPIFIDDQKNGWVNTDPSYPEDRGALRMRALALYEGKPSVKYVTPDSSRDIASVEGVYLNPDFSGVNYYDASALEPPMMRTGTVDPSDATRKTVIISEPDRVLNVTGVFAGETPVGENYFLGEGYPNTVKWQEAVLAGTNTVWPRDPMDIVSIKGVYLSMDTNTATYLAAGTGAADASQTARVFGRLVKPNSPNLITQLLGIYLTSSVDGQNYYNNVAPTVPYFFNVNQDMPAGTASVSIRYKDAGGNINWQSGTVYVSSVQPNDPVPIAEVQGVYGSVTYDTQGIPTGVGTNYASSSGYVNGGTAIQLTPPVPVNSLPGSQVVYKSLPYGFGPTSEYIATNKSLDMITTLGAYVAYYPRGAVSTVNGKSFITLSKPLPTGISEVGVRVNARAFVCGDTAIPLTKDLPEGTGVAYVKYADVRYTHQLRGSAMQPVRQLWTQGTSHYTPDGWSAGASGVHWMSANVVDPYVIIPQTVSAMVTVQGVYLAANSDGDDYYLGTTSPYAMGDDYVTLARPLPAGTRQVFVSYSPANVHMQNNLTDITSGIIGAWLNSSRDGVNYFNPRQAMRHQDNPSHLRLTTPVPEGTFNVWARYYQKGDYHIDRWNRDVVFVDGKEKVAGTKIQASYFFGTKMPFKVGPNTVPVLLDGKISRLRGGRSDQYVYTVTYRDLDGPNGQKPLYVKVYIDGTPYEMTPVNATPAYREGAVYTYTLSGQSGGSHKYHFEASDGAAVGLYDWYDRNSQDRPATGQTIKDIDGPWVNNPPDLSNGAVTPNPAAGINTSDSVDYTVTYTDPDNDGPYFYDPVRDTSTVDSNKNGIPDVREWSGAPRVWIDSGAYDETFTGTVQSLEADPMQPSKKRTIVAAGNPGWTPDKFATKHLQITNGVLAGRVYLIQSNSANKLIIATEDLGADGVKGATDAQPSEFRINGLLMSKADPAQQDFTAGVQYKLTVPKLATGDHKFHFTARSRETKPQWLLDMLTDPEKVTYSIEARYPAGVDSPGPKVQSTRPTGNSAPTLSGSKESSLFVGPVYQAAVATGLGQVEASDATVFAQIREVRGVFENANDFDLSAVADEASLNYYDTLTASPAFKPLDQRIMLTRQLPATPATTRVQFGKVKADSDSLLTVTPDVAGVIGTVRGVYVESDRALAGTNYYNNSLGNAAGSFADGKITLGQPLPSGSKLVYVEYSLKTGSSWTSNPAVPVYVKYFKSVAINSSTVLLAGDLVTFRVTYNDADDDSPSYHDGVQGFVRVVFNDLGYSVPMQLLNPTGGAADYSGGIAFTTVPMHAPEGKHKYHFEASDGWDPVVTWPQGSVVSPRANDYEINVNYKPVLSAGRVDPTAGQAATPFTMTVNYKDPDGLSTAQPQVYARISSEDGLRGYLRKVMAPKSTAYPQGADFFVTIQPDQLTPKLASGSYKVVFEATDNSGEDADPSPSPSQTQVTFTVRDHNTAPVLSELSVTPGAGKLLTDYVYRVKYSDADGDAPKGKATGTKDVLALVIDKGMATEYAVQMIKAAGQPAAPTAQNYIDGVVYESAKIKGSKLGPGRHTYEVSAGDGTSDAEPIWAEGPVLLIPYFDRFKAVAADAPSLDGAPAVTQATVGQEVKFTAIMKFPANSVAVPADPLDNITINVTKPDRSVLSLSATAVRDTTYTGTGWAYKVTAKYPKDIDPALTSQSLKLISSGDWSATMSWPATTEWDGASTVGREVRISVGGPMRTIAVSNPSYPDESSPLVDMITPPKVINSGDIGAIFGVDRAVDMQVVRWDPQALTYFRYGGQSIFPPLQSGQAIWIKPRPTYPGETILMSQVNSGLLTLGNPEVAPTELKKYRLIKAFVKDYDTDPVTHAVLPCVIPLSSGWNQFGNIFFNWKKDSSGTELMPRVDVGMPINELSVRYLGITKTLSQAAAAGWVRDYAWRYDAPGHRYVQVSATAAGAERAIKAWSGYWIKAFVDCDLIISPTTTYNGVSTAAAAAAEVNAMSGEKLDMPPPVPE